MTTASEGVLRLIDDIIVREGDYTNNPADKGGPTRWGVTEKVARDNGYAGDMRALPKETAREIYLKRYYVEPGFDQIDPIARQVADELTDTGVNMGTATAGKFLQRCLNALNRGGTDYPDVTPDGNCGQKTRDALAAYMRKRGRDGVRVLLTAMNCLQGARYVEIAENTPSQEAFEYGWLANRVVLKTD